MEEIWKPVVGFEKKYAVSNLGRVRNRHGKILKQFLAETGYYKLSLKKDVGYKCVYVHRLVVHAFLRQSPPIVDHIDGKRGNNCLSNLRPCTHRRNMNYFYKRKYPGLTKTSTGWGSQIRLKNKTIHLGVFDTKTEAGSAYLGAMKLIEKLNLDGVNLR